MATSSRLIILSPVAHEDLILILDYTYHQWGERQVQLYQTKIDSVFQLLAQHPQMGQKRTDFSETYYTFPVEAHIIIYRLHEEALEIIRILHQNMDPLRHL